MTPDSARRLGVLGVVTLALFAALFSRLWYLQVMTADEFQTVATTNSQRIIRDPAPRGRILDRNGKVLVDNRLSIVVTIDPAEVPGGRLSKPDDPKRDDPNRVALLDRVAKDVSRYTGKPLDRDTIEKRLADVRYSPYQPVPIAEDVPKELEIYIAEHKDEFRNAVAVTTTTVRRYPYGPLAAHVLGYVGAINDKELQERVGSPKSYSLQDDIGKTGIERIYEDDLRGTPGRLILEVDNKGNPIRTLADEPPIAGHDLILTIDADVQAVTEQALAQELDNARHRRNPDGSYNEASAGSAVVVDPNNGQVVAMASYPTYNPAAFTSGISTELWDTLNDKANFFPLINRAIQGQYAPGSTYKLLTAYAGLKSGAIAADTTVRDTGIFTVPGCKGDETAGCTFRNAQGKAHGYVALPEALTVSSDVFFYSLGARFWRERGTFGDPIQTAAQTFGLGASTGIPLSDEQVGWVPTPENKQARHDQNPEAFPNADWFTGDNVNLAIGQGDNLATPLQLADAYAALANGGTLYSPNVVLRVQRANTPDVVRTIDPRVLRQIDLPPEIRQPILDGLAGVTHGNGTASAAFSGFPETWPVAGKTGTAEVTDKTKSDNALFVGFGPVHAPQYAAAAVLEHSGFGSGSAAPLVRQILQMFAEPEGRPVVQPVPPGGTTYTLSAPIPGATEKQTSEVRD